VKEFYVYYEHFLRKGKASVMIVSDTMLLGRRLEDIQGAKRKKAVITASH
jgi:hypothetical protein